MPRDPIDLRHKDPERTELNAKTASYDDLVDQMLVISRSLQRYETAMMSRHASDTIRDSRQMIKVIELFIRRVTDERAKNNKTFGYS